MKQLRRGMFKLPFIVHFVSGRLAATANFGGKRHVPPARRQHSENNVLAKISADAAGKDPNFHDGGKKDNNCLETARLFHILVALNYTSIQPVRTVGTGWTGSGWAARSSSSQLSPAKHMSYLTGLEQAAS